ncbi:unnamed protein product, partial [Discosporangium mesarthrocarpum]
GALEWEGCLGVGVVPASRFFCVHSVVVVYVLGAPCWALIPGFPCHLAPLRSPLKKNGSDDRTWKPSPSFFSCCHPCWYSWLMQSFHGCLCASSPLRGQQN